MSLRAHRKCVLLQEKHRRSDDRVEVDQGTTGASPRICSLTLTLDVQSLHAGRVEGGHASAASENFLGHQLLEYVKSRDRGVSSIPLHRNGS